MAFKNHFLPKLKIYDEENFQVFFFQKQKILNFFQKFIYVEKIFYFARFLKAIFQKMKQSKIDQWQLGYDFFLANFKGL